MIYKQNESLLRKGAENTPSVEGFKNWEGETSHPIFWERELVTANLKMGDLERKTQKYVNGIVEKSENIFRQYIIQKRSKR